MKVRSVDLSWIDWFENTSIDREYIFIAFAVHDWLTTICSGGLGTIYLVIGIAIILVILIIVATLVIILVRKLNRRRRKGQSQGSLKNSGCGLNFSTLVEEPDLDFNRGSRKLHFGGTSSNA